ncbi:MAG: hypothetical protein IKO51_10345 [Clostridia bacterium]|nr:hypothetical protein [Clostridia bacterium]
MYAKIISHVFTPAPRRAVIGSEQVFNPTEAQLAALGYKPVIFTEPSEVPEGFYAEIRWEETEDSIVQTWTLAAASDGASGAD